MAQGRSVRLDDFLRDQVKDQLKAPIPAPLFSRLDDLRRRAEIGKRIVGDVTQEELVAVLIYSAPTSAASLSAMVGRYRNASVRSALVDVPKGKTQVKLPPRGPGRPARR